MLSRVTGTLARSAAVVLALGLLACGTARMAPGPETERHQLALIRGSGWPFVEEVEILGVDGEKIGLTKNKALVRPGPHTVQVLVQKNFLFFVSSAREEIAFEALAGHEYAVHAAMEPARVKLWVEDRTTAEIVARE